MREVLAIPLEEVRKQFEVNERQSLKIVAPARLGAELFARLQSLGVEAKPEAPLAGPTWRHSPPSGANRVCESREFTGADLPAEATGGFTISFGNQHGLQERHRHHRHAEIYFSEHPLEAEYETGSGERGTISLAHGGTLVFAARVWHCVKLGGLTIVIEVPAVEGDKEISPT